MSRRPKKAARLACFLAHDWERRESTLTVRRGSCLQYTHLYLGPAVLRCRVCGKAKLAPRMLAEKCLYEPLSHHTYENPIVEGGGGRPA